MGAQGAGQGISRDLVLDTGALIAYERGDRAVREAIHDVLEGYGELTIPAGVLAQVWRGGPRSSLLARLLEGLDIDPLDEQRAKEVGLRLGARDSADVTDAHVACCAAARRAAVLTSDPKDIAALFAPDEPRSLIPV